MALLSPSAIAKAHKIAQKNAEELLGLAPDNTSLDRAKALGFNLDYKHGTQRLDRLLEREGLDPKRATSGSMPYGTDSPEIASGYAKGKQDTSLYLDDPWATAFEVSPKQLGLRGSIPYSVEKSYHHLPKEVQDDILDKYYRVGYADKDNGTGDYILHPSGANGSIASKNHLDWVLKEHKGNPLESLRDLWLDSGELYGREEDLNKIFKLAGYPHEISNTNAPFITANGILTGKAKLSNPLVTDNYDEINALIPKLDEAFKRDRTRKAEYGVDHWAKDTTYTPKEWVDELRKDTQDGTNSYVWTSIPDKVTKELKKQGYDGILDVGGKSGGNPHQVVIPFEPHQVRSQFAVFDPKKLGIGAGSVMSADLLANEINQAQANDKGLSKYGLLTSQEGDVLQASKPNSVLKYMADSYKYASDQGGLLGNILYEGGAKALDDLAYGTTPMQKVGRLKVPTPEATLNLMNLLQL